MTPGVAPLRPPPRGRRSSGGSSRSRRPWWPRSSPPALTVVSSDARRERRHFADRLEHGRRQNSGKCVDAGAAGHGERHRRPAVHLQQQHRAAVAVPADQRRLRADQRADQRRPGLDVANVSTADGALIHLWAFGSGNNQQWLPVEEADGAYHLVNRNSGKCLDVPSASTADSIQLQQYTCNGTAAQSFRITPLDTPPRSPVPGPRPERLDLRPVDAEPAIQSRLDQVFSSKSRTSTASSGTRCCSSRASTTSARMSGSSPRSPGLVSRRTT